MADTGFIICAASAQSLHVGSVIWASAGSITADDDTEAFSTISGSGVTRFLEATDYSAQSIPAGATIDGAEAQYEGDLAADAPTVTTVQLINQLGTVVGDDKGDGRDWKDAQALDTFGGAADLWGTTPSKAELDDVDSGWGISATGAAGASQARVDAMWRKIYYTEAAGGGRIMSSLVNAGGLAGLGGIAGQGGGLAG